MRSCPAKVGLPVSNAKKIFKSAEKGRLSPKCSAYFCPMPRNNILDDFDFDENQYFEEHSGEVVAKFYSPLEAEVAAARLRSEGIPCFLANATSQSVLPHLQLLVRLHVRPEDAERARFLLAEAAIDTEEPENRTENNRFLVGLAIVIGLLLAILLVRAIWLMN